MATIYAELDECKGHWPEVIFVYDLLSLATIIRIPVSVNDDLQKRMPYCLFLYSTLLLFSAGPGHGGR